MPQAVSKRQYRMMMAVLHGKPGHTARGDSGPPKSIAGKYAGKGKSPGDDAPESKGKEHEGGKWNESGHAKETAKTKKKREDKKKRKAELRKALENYIRGKDLKGAGCIVVDKCGHILLGKRMDTGQYATPGGHVDDMEDHEQAALRELREETGIVGQDPELVHSGIYRGYDSKQFVVRKFKGRLKDTDEMCNLKFIPVHEIPWDDLTDYTRDALCTHICDKLKKSRKLSDMIAYEDLQKNIIRSGSAPSNTIYEVTHGDALRLIGNGTFRMLRDGVRDMGDEDFRDLTVDNYTLHIRKHTNDVYSGRIVDGHKQIHQFTNKSLPAVAAELMSVFEWYLPEDESELEILDDDALSDDIIEGGVNELVERYRKHNIVNIYTEMENIREEMRHGMAVDVQQVEAKIMVLFDRLEETVLNIVDNHNKLNSEAGEAIDMLEGKLRTLQSTVERLAQQPTQYQAYSPSPPNSTHVHSEFYPYLSQPTVTVCPDGHIKISFDKDWTPMERENFLGDMKAKAVKKLKKSND